MIGISNTYPPKHYFDSGVSYTSQATMSCTKEAPTKYKHYLAITSIYALSKPDAYQDG